MRATISFPSYNEKRYGTPWIAKITSWPVGGKPEIEFGNYCGDARHGGAGEVEIEAVPGTVLRWGQKDHRNSKHTEANWGILQEDGSVTECTMTEARKHFSVVPDKVDNPLAQFTTEELLAELKNRGAL